MINLQQAHYTFSSYFVHYTDTRYTPRHVICIPHPAQRKKGQRRIKETRTFFEVRIGYDDGGGEHAGDGVLKDGFASTLTDFQSLSR